MQNDEKVTKEPLYSIELLFKGIEIPSTNHSYLSLPRYYPAKHSRTLHNGKPTRISTYKTKSKVYKDMERDVWKEMDKQLTPEDIKKYQDLLLSDQQLSVEVDVDFGFSEDGYFTRDTSNYIKSLEDAVKVRLGIDDSRHTKVSLTKHILKAGDWTTLYDLKVIKNSEYVDKDWNSAELRY